MQAMLLAAGLGTRLRPYTYILPKPLFPVLNRPLLHHLIDMLHGAGCVKIVVNGHHLGHLVKDAVRHLSDVEFQDETEILGTGGGLRQALARFSPDPVLVVNGDIFHNVDLAEIYRLHVKSGNKVTLALHDHPRFNSVAVCNDRIVSFRAAGNAGEEKLLAFTGIHVVEPEIIKRIPVGRFHHIIDLYEILARQREQVGYIRVDGSFWRDIGTPEDYLLLHKELLEGECVTNVPLSGVHGQWLVADQARIADDVILAGWGCVGRADIGSRAILKNCVVWDDAVVADDSCLENRIITGRQACGEPGTP